MGRVVFGIFLALLGATYAFAEGPAFTLDGEVFSKRFSSDSPKGERLVEYVRDTETFENWQKLIGLRYQLLPRLGNDPVKMARAMVKVVHRHNPKVKTHLRLDKRHHEATLDFLTWPKDGSYMEFNLFRYARSGDGKAVVSLQLAYRFTDKSKTGIDRFQSLRASWRRQAARFSFADVEAALGVASP